MKIKRRGQGKGKGRRGQGKGRGGGGGRKGRARGGEIREEFFLRVSSRKIVSV